MKAANRTRRNHPAFVSLSRAGQLLMGGHALILLALGDFTSHLVTNSTEHLLYTEHFLSSLSLSAILLWSGALVLDYLEHRMKWK